MNRCDFSSISTCLKNHISESNQMSQPDFLYELFEDFMDDPANQDFSMDNGLVCRWMTGQAKISPKISAYYSKPSNQEKLAHTIHQNLLPLMSDCNMAIQDIYTLFIQDDSISDAKKKNLTPLYKPASSRLLFLAKLISFGMERQFIKRNTKNQKLLAGGALSPIVLDYIMDSEVPKPCRHFIGRDKELEELYTMLEENRHVFLCGIAGIGKSELAKAYAKRYIKQYTNILYVEYTGNLHQDITDMDFIDDLPESTEQERFQRHNRFLRSLKSDTLLIIDNFNVTATQDSFLSVVLKYRCQILFTTRSKLDEYCTLPLKEIEDMNALFQLASVFYSEADTYRATVEKIIETVHSHTFAVELAAKLLENGISTPDQLLTRLQVEKASFHNEDKIKIIKDGQSSKATYYSHIHTLFSLYTLSLEQQDIMCNMCFLPSTGISARIFAKWLELPTLNEINDLIETGFVQTTTRRTISLHPMIQEITLSETKPSVTRCHILLDFQATLETKPEKAIKLEKDALAQIETITVDNARLVSNLHANLGGLYRMNGHPDLAREHMEKSISLLDQFNLLHINDSIPQIANYAMFLTEQQEPERGISELQKLSGIIKEYHSDDCLDYAKVQETLGTIYLMTANLPQAKTHFKRAFKIYEKIWADEPEMIEAKYQEIQELYPQIGFCIGKNLSGLLTK